MRRALLATAATLILGVSAGAPATAPARTGSPANVDAGLAALVQPPSTNGIRALRRNHPAPAAIRDAAGRVLVAVTAAGGVGPAALEHAAVRRGLRIVHRHETDDMVEGYVATEQVTALAGAREVHAVTLVPRPRFAAGATTTQGVVQHRIDKLPKGVDGRGVTVGLVSDSFDIGTTAFDGNPMTIHAADDIASGDLPGPGNPVNPHPVTVLFDDFNPDSVFDEGRAMAQIVHDIAPRAKLCFSNPGFTPEDFAATILALADKRGPCRADVIVDDFLGQSDPWFSDGVVSDAIDAVAARGIHYVTCAGNAGGQRAWSASVRLRPVAGATAGTNIDLTGVDPRLYAGGFEDFDPGPGVDIAQSATSFGSDFGELVMQWDDPFDPDGPTLGDPVLSTSGEITAAQPVASIPFAGSAGQSISVRVDAIPSGTTDLILTVRDPGGAVLDEQDTGTSPESSTLELPVTGTYTIEVSGFEGDLGDFTAEVRPVLAPSRTTSDFNVLVFDADGAFLSAAASQNALTGQPIERTAPPAGDLQLVIARARTESPAATRLRVVTGDFLVLNEYADPRAPAIVGHNMARRATSVAGYAPTQPYVPEAFSSFGGDLPVLFNSSGRRLATPRLRRVPDVAALDGGNTTFFGFDTPTDDDTFPNFFGTSASAPHAAAIAALVLQRRGGPGSVSPAAMRNLLQASAFPHDRDPFHAAASTGALSITADGSPGQEGVTPGSMNDPRFFTVRYSGRGTLVRLILDGKTANPTGYGLEGPRSDGLLFDPRPYDPVEQFAGGFPFTVGRTSPGISPADVKASFSIAGIGFGGPSQFRRLAISFTRGKLGAGRSVSFGVDRDEAVTRFFDASEGNNADQLGGGTMLPQGTVRSSGMSYAALLSDGRVLRGELANRIGFGHSPWDGFGFINGQAAVKADRGGSSTAADRDARAPESAGAQGRLGFAPPRFNLRHAPQPLPVGSQAASS